MEIPPDSDSGDFGLISLRKARQAASRTIEALPGVNLLLFLKVLHQPLSHTGTPGPFPSKLSRENSFPALNVLHKNAPSIWVALLRFPKIPKMCGYVLNNTDYN